MFNTAAGQVTNLFSQNRFRLIRKAARGHAGIAMSPAPRRDLMRSRAKAIIGRSSMPPTVTEAVKAAPAGAHDYVDLPPGNDDEEAWVYDIFAHR